MREGDLILTSLQQADGQYKLRPVLVLRQLPTYDDFLVCGISTQLHQEILNFDVVLEAHADNGLRANSLIRLSFLAILSVSDRRATIGRVNATTHRLLLSRLSTYLVQ
jgi:mRNA interferase MazF